MSSPSSRELLLCSAAGSPDEAKRFALKTVGRSLAAKGLNCRVSLDAPSSRGRAGRVCVPVSFEGEKSDFDGDGSELALVLPKPAGLGDGGPLPLEEATLLEETEGLWAGAIADLVGRLSSSPAATGDAVPSDNEEGVQKRRRVRRKKKPKAPGWGRRFIESLMPRQPHDLSRHYQEMKESLKALDEEKSGDQPGAADLKAPGSVLPVRALDTTRKPPEEHGEEEDLVFAPSFSLDPGGAEAPVDEIEDVTEPAPAAGKLPPPKRDPAPGSPMGPAPSPPESKAAIPGAVRRSSFTKISSESRKPFVARRKIGDGNESPPVESSSDEGLG